MTNPADYMFSMPIKVRDYELDAQGIVNNANYLHYLEHTRHEFCAEVGATFSRMNALGLTPVVRRIDINYLSSLSSDMTAISCLNLKRDGVRFLFEQAMFREDTGEPVVKATVTIVSTNGGRLLRGDELAELFKSYI